MNRSIQQATLLMLLSSVFLWASACGDSAPSGDSTGDLDISDTEELTLELPTEDISDPDVPDLREISFGGDDDVDETPDGTDPTEPDEPNCTGEVFDYMCACNENADCASGYCIPVNDDDVAMRCTRICDEGCEGDWLCRGMTSGADPTFLCVPPLETLCAPCERNADCREVGALCLDTPDGKFCGRSCGEDGMCPSGYQCEEILNEEGQVIASQCQPDSGSCVCDDTIDYDNDPNHCGACQNLCEFPNALATCEAGGCVMGACLPGYIDLDGNPENGCEYACIPDVGDTTFDEPEVHCEGSACDRNCDGINGSYEHAIFVAGHGSAQGAGTAEDPLNDITAAIAKAQSQNKKHVYVAQGTYEGAITLQTGISLFGGYSNDGLWRRDVNQYQTILQNGVGINAIRVIIADQIRSERTVLDGFSILAGNNPNPGGSSYAIWVRNSDTSLVIQNVTAIGGHGGQGSEGANGVRGNDGNVGHKGAKGGRTTNVSQGADGGPGGADSCGRGRSAAGGRGGRSTCNDGMNHVKYPGEAGWASPGGAQGGSNPRGNGHGGGNGLPGTLGNGGTSAGQIIADYWYGIDGSDGGYGENGIGGGGGGGGGGGKNVLHGRCGGGGGGGGGGGCGGAFGKGGKAGGGSFGIFLVDASPTLKDAKFGRKNGGNGGKGGAGGAGGQGQAGGDGGDPFDSHASAGGKGGKGGNGGSGGHGGGGAGGVAYSMYFVGSSSPVCSALDLAPAGYSGSGGAGGVAPTGGNKGADGSFGPKNGNPSTCR